MANVRLDVGYQIKDGTQLSFYAPCDFKEIEKLVIYYPSNGEVASHVFTFKDAQGNDLTDFNELFAKDACVKVILSVSKSSAYIQNAPTSGVHTAIGSNLSLTGTKAGGLKLVNVKGATKQKTLTGKNLFGGMAFVSALQQSGANISVNTPEKRVSLSANSNTSKFSYNDFKENTQYTLFIRGWQGSSGYTSTNLRVGYTDGTKIELKFNSDRNIQNIFVSAKGKTISYLAGVWAEGTSHIYYEDFGIFEGVLTLEDFEPYIDGIELRQGRWNGETGDFATSETSICTKIPVVCKSGDKVKVILEKAMTLQCVYSNGSSHLSYAGVDTVSEHEFTIPTDATMFKLNIIDSNGITPETVGKVLVTVNGKPIYIKPSPIMMMQGYRNITTGEYYNDTNFISNKNPIPCKLGDVITLESEKVRDYLYILPFSGEKLSADLVKAKGDTNTVTLTVTSSNTTHFCINIRDTVAITPETVGKITLKINDVTLYVGEQPTMTSPSPYYPQAIENVFDCVEMIQGIYDYQTGIYKSVNTHICNKQPIPCKQGDNIKLLLEYTGDVGKGIVFYKNGERVTTTYALEATVPSDVDSFNFSLSFEGITPQTVGKISLTVNGKHVMQILEHGKNLFDIESYLKAHNRSYTENDGVYTFYTTTSLFSTPLSFSDKDINISVSGTITNIDASNVRIEFLNSKNEVVFSKTPQHNDAQISGYASKVRINYSAHGQFSLANIQIEEGSVTPYEPYTEKVATIYLDEPLREGDRLVKIDGVWNVERNMAEAVFDGTEKYTASSSATDVFIISNRDNTTKLKGLKTLNDYGVKTCIISDHFTATPYVDNSVMADGTCAYFMGNGDSFKFRHSATTSLDEWVEYISEQYTNGTPVKIQYYINPTLTPLDLESQIALNRLKTFNDATHVEINSVVKAEAEFKYGKTETVASALTAELLGHETMLTVKGCVANNLTTTEEGFVLDARQGKALFDLYTELANRITTLESNQ